ncbi:MAG: hypothetical protein F6K45_23110 [Kamptonema sp. SIO1D9]|nr:hypothetical protein [Kamptonema sp. SIO1D9]
MNNNQGKDNKKMIYRATCLPYKFIFQAYGYSQEQAKNELIILVRLLTENSPDFINIEEIYYS